MIKHEIVPALKCSKTHVNAVVTLKAALLSLINTLLITTYVHALRTLLTVLRDPYSLGCYPQRGDDY